MNRTVVSRGAFYYLLPILLFVAALSINHYNPPADSWRETRIWRSS